MVGYGWLMHVGTTQIEQERSGVACQRRQSFAVRPGSRSNFRLYSQARGLRLQSPVTSANVRAKLLALGVSTIATLPAVPDSRG